MLEANPRAQRTVPLVSQGMQHPDGEPRHAGHARERRSGPGSRRARDPAFRREGGGLPVQHVPGSRSASRPGDAFHRRGPRIGGAFRGRPSSRRRTPPASSFRWRERCSSPSPSATGRAVLEAARRFARTWASPSWRRDGTQAVPRSRTASRPSRSSRCTRGGPTSSTPSRTARSNWSSTRRPGKASKFDDSYIRKTAIRHKVPYITTTAAAIATAKGISAHRQGPAGVRSLQQYHAGIAG